MGNRVEEDRGDQPSFRKCYAETVRVEIKRVRIEEDDKDHLFRRPMGKTLQSDPES